MYRKQKKAPDDKNPANTKPDLNDADSRRKDVLRHLKQRVKDLEERYRGDLSQMKELVAIPYMYSSLLILVDFDQYAQWADEMSTKLKWIMLQWQQAPNPKQEIGSYINMLHIPLNEMRQKYPDADIPTQELRTFALVRNKRKASKASEDPPKKTSKHTSQPIQQNIAQNAQILTTALFQTSAFRCSRNASFL